MTNFPETKGMSVDRMLDHLCDLKLWHWPWIFKVKYLKSRTARRGGVHWYKTKMVWVERKIDPLCNLELWPSPWWPWTWIFMDRRGCESIGWTQYVTLPYGNDLELASSNFKIIVSHKWDGHLTWNERDVSRRVFRSTMWHWLLIWHVTLNLDF